MSKITILLTFEAFFFVFYTVNLLMNPKLYLTHFRKKVSCVLYENYGRIVLPNL